MGGGVMLSFWCPRPSFAPEPGLLSRFAQSRSGNISMMFAVLSVPMIAAVGLGVDLSRAYRVRSLTQNALDASVLAAGRAAQTNVNAPLSAAQAAATNFYDASKPSDVVSSSLSLAADNNNTTFTLTATTWVSTPFLSVLSRMFPKSTPADAPAGCSNSFACLKLTSTAQASIAAGGNGGSNVEVSLMLDVTGSMNGTKLTTLKSAAKDLVDTIIWTDQSKYTSRMAIVPFAPYVNVGSAFYTAVTGQSQSTCYWMHNGICYWPGPSYDSCVKDRTGTHAYTETSPGVGSWIPSAQQTNCEPSAEIVPLTSNKTTLKNLIDNLQAKGGTAGALGTAWAWYMISPAWATIWGTASAPASYADLSTLNSNGAPKLKKFAVLMTDGDYNVMGGSNVSTSTVNSAALSLCSGMKNKGIEVFTVGFQVGNTAKTMLQSCATDTSHFYDASSNDALLAAFRDIALKISSLRLTN